MNCVDRLDQKKNTFQIERKSKKLRQRNFLKTYSKHFPKILKKMFSKQFLKTFSNNISRIFSKSILKRLKRF